MRRNLLLPLIAFAAYLAPVPSFAFQGNGIVPSKEGKRTIYVDDSTPPKTTPSRSKARASGPLVYWSQSERRWKPVPAYTPLARRQARTAAAEVERYIASRPQSPANGSEAATANPWYRGIAQGRSVTASPVVEALNRLTGQTTQEQQRATGDVDTMLANLGMGQQQMMMQLFAQLLGLGGR